MVELKDLQSSLKVLHYFRKNPPSREARPIIAGLIDEVNVLLVPMLKAEREAKGEPEPEAQTMGRKKASLQAKSIIKGTDHSTAGEIDVVYIDEPTEDETFTINLGE